MLETASKLRRTAPNRRRRPTDVSIAAVVYRSSTRSPNSSIAAKSTTGIVTAALVGDVDVICEPLAAA